MASRHYKYNSSCSIMRIWSSGLLLRRVLPGTRPVTTTLGTHPGDNNLWESVTSIAGNPQRKSRTRHIPGDIYRWASHLEKRDGEHAGPGAAADPVGRRPVGGPESDPPVVSRGGGEASLTQRHCVECYGRERRGARRP